MLNCCLPKHTATNIEDERNLFSTSNCKEKLLFLYSFLENSGYDLKQYPKVVSNIRSVCGSECCDDSTTSIIDTGLQIKVSFSVTCDDNSVIAESYVIY